MRRILEVDLHEGGDGGLFVAAKRAAVAKTGAFIQAARLDIADTDLEPDGVEAALPGRLKEGLQQETSDAVTGVLRIDDHALEFGC